MSLLTLFRPRVGAPVDVEATVDFIQPAASWAATVTAPATDVYLSAGWKRPTPIIEELRPVFARAAFEQSPARWRAVVDVNDDAVILGLTENVLELV